MEGGQACLKGAYHPKETEAILLDAAMVDLTTQGYERDEHSSAMWRKKCGDGYYRIGDFCFSRCPDGLEKCGLICIDKEFICTQDVIDKSLEGFKQISFDPASAEEYTTNVLSTEGHWCAVSKE